MLAMMGRPATLIGQSNPDGTACLWIEGTEGRVVLIWPSGYKARGNPLTVLDADGKEVAVVGEQIQFGGGGSIGFDNPKAVLGCGIVSSAFSVGSRGKTK